MCRGSLTSPDADAVNKMADHKKTTDPHQEGVSKQHEYALSEQMETKRLDWPAAIVYLYS